MILFFFSFLASLLGGISAGSLFNVSPDMQLFVDNPASGIIKLWPFMVAILIFLLSILWYQALEIMERNKAQGGSKTRYSKYRIIYIVTITVFGLILVATPFVISRLGQDYLNTEITLPENLVETVVTVHGMDCTGCESLVNKNVGDIKGVEKVTASFQRKEVEVLYDQSKTSLEEIAETIEKSGYTVVLE